MTELTTYANCPWCGKRNVPLVRRTGQLYRHNTKGAPVGQGFRGLAENCKGSNRKPEAFK